ncbi:thioredoxin [Providencia phage PSTRCR_121]|nr:thioredoxin [Providencia phage PSTRCR_121]
MIKIYGFNPDHFKCAPCINAKRFCETKGHEYEFISVSSAPGPEFNQEVIAELLQMLGRESQVGLTMPQVFIDGVSIGGFDDLRKHKWN